MANNSASPSGSTFTGIVSALALLLYTVFLGVFLYAMIAVKILLPPLRQRIADPAIVAIASLWIQGILWWINHVGKVQWDIQGLERSRADGWYLITANHQSWVDIFALYQVYLGKAPLLKFFIKHELGYLPIVGQAWWALDFPFMRRYTKDYLKKHPEKAGQDLLETQRACEKFSQTPTSVMNFLEGTRLTDAKHRQQQSPYRHLLKPKAGGLAFAIQALGERFDALTNVTIAYPHGTPSFWDLMCGRVAFIRMVIEEIPIPPHFCQGDYQNDPHLRQEMQHWTSAIWEKKDALLARLLASESHEVIKQERAKQPQNVAN
ncbi:acyltransferase [Bacterioplanes sanyensis]|uniref:Acyltransferase n=1 Tax=Bacterioplanes sanyensis TaxID=1249553 RepID=A0A222FMX1_9GAMM|nr:acyltransferase [Bacterioplanes sanyensis]ASP39573.1 acyltransferase [Bacterioplanes sanyensis]